MINNLLSHISSFDFYYSYEFWLVFLVALVLYRILDPQRTASRVVTLVTSVLMVLALPRFSVAHLGFLSGLALAVFGVGRLLLSDWQRENKTIRAMLSGLTICAVIFLLAFFKYRFFQDFIVRNNSILGLHVPDYIFILGISYSSFRMIHFTIEAYSRRLQDVELLLFLNYVFFFPAFISGPIHRYNHFAAQWAGERTTELSDDLREGVFRIVNGLFKKLVVAGLIYQYTLPEVVALPEFTTPQLLLGIYAYTIYFYLDFSGYSDIAIGSARVLGFELPENFKDPFFKSNIQQLWANWHISLTSWLTDYVYWPSVRWLRRGKAFQEHPVLLSNIGIIITFLVCGLWHGEGLNFVLWGLYHGVGIAVLNTYRAGKRKVRSPILRKYFQSRTSRILGIVMTFNFFALGIVLFSLSMPALRQLIERL